MPETDQEPRYDLRGGERWRDPYADYRNLRDHDPVHRVEHPEFGEFWVLSRFADVFEAARDTATFSSASGLTLDRDAMKMFGTPKPRLALAGLNPHAGENGVLGDEDDRVLVPAIRRARARRVNIEGPIPGDTVFVRAARGEFDCVIACYHDQGLIPVKLLAFGNAVNVTIGLPIIRTSVDHGTAFDIAGKGVADAGSMIAAVKLAAAMASARARS